MAVVDVEGVASAGGNRAGKRAAEDDLPWLKLHVVWREFVRQPRHAVRRVVKHACGDPGLFDHAVAVKQGGDPAQIQLGSV